MKRILFMHQTSSIGGGSYCLLNILKAIDRSVVEPIACLVSDGPLRKEIEMLGIEVIFFSQMSQIPYNQSMWKINSIKAYRKIDRSIPAFKTLLMDNHIDVVYLNNMMIYRYLKPAKDVGCKTILHCREHWPLDEHKEQLQWARNAVKKYADELIAINHYSASIFLGKEATIVYDWVDFSHRDIPISFDSIFDNYHKDDKVILFTGGFSKIKGAYEILNSFSKDLISPEYKLLVLGGNIDCLYKKGVKHYIKKILRIFGYRYYELSLLQILNKDSRIKCIPALYEIKSIISQSYCSVSFFTIPHANLALAEGIILGLPSIAANTEESLEYSMNGNLAHLIEINNTNELSNAVAKIDEIVSMLQPKIRKDKETICTMFMPETNISLLNSVILRVCR